MSAATVRGRTGDPNPAAKGQQQGHKQTATPRPSARTGGAKEARNTEKRRLNWHNKCLQAVRVEVKFPKEG